MTKSIRSLAQLWPLSAVIVSVPLWAQPGGRQQTLPEAPEVWEPVPAVVDPGAFTQPGTPPSDAVILFYGADLLNGSALTTAYPLAGSSAMAL